MYKALENKSIGRKNSRTLTSLTLINGRISQISSQFGYDLSPVNKIPNTLQVEEICSSSLQTFSVLENHEGDESLFRAKRGARAPTFPPFFSLAPALKFKEKSCEFDSNFFSTVNSRQEGFIEEVRHRSDSLADKL